MTQFKGFIRGDHPTTNGWYVGTIPSHGANGTGGNLQKRSYIYPLVMTDIAMENCPFIDGLPIIKGDFPWLC